MDNPTPPTKRKRGRPRLPPKPKVWKKRGRPKLPPRTHKKCPRCNRVRAVYYFSKMVKRYGGGLQVWCKDCFAEVYQIRTAHLRDDWGYHSKKDDWW